MKKDTKIKVLKLLTILKKLVGKYKEDIELLK